MSQKDGDFYCLFDDVYAVVFPYAIVTERTLWMALTSKIRRDMAQKSIQARFAAESEITAGKLRADSEIMRRCFPIEIAMLEAMLSEKTLKDYVIFKIL